MVHSQIVWARGDLNAVVVVVVVVIIIYATRLPWKTITYLSIVVVFGSSVVVVSIAFFLFVFLLKIVTGSSNNVF